MLAVKSRSYQKAKNNLSGKLQTVAFIVALLGLLSVSTVAEAQEQLVGGAERYIFEPGDKVIYQNDFANCPVGEIVPEIKPIRNSYECARFKDRIWIRPLEHSTHLVMSLDFPKEFSFEFDCYSFPKAGNPRVHVFLYRKSRVERVLQGDFGLRAVVAVCSEDEFRGGIESDPKRDVEEEYRRKIEPGQIHHIAIQLRRNQLRIYVDGQRVAQEPYQANEPFGAVLMTFWRTYEFEKPFAEVPALITNLRLAGYSQPELPPGAETDLIKQLGAVQTEEGLKITLQEAVLFDFGKWELKPGASDVLDKVAQLALLRRKPLRVEGHTDNVGGEQLNLVLSELRAYVVAMELIKRGVNPEWITVRGYGETRPVAPNDTDENRAKNRRVEIILAS